MKAAAVVCLANIVRAMAGASVPVRSQRIKVAGDNREAWPLTAQHYSQYSAHDLRPCMLRYAHLLANGNPELKVKVEFIYDLTKLCRRYTNNVCIKLSCRIVNVIVACCTIQAARRKYDNKELSLVIDDLHKVSNNLAMDILRFTR
jgi:hypothetical protein